MNAKTYNTLKKIFPLAFKFSKSVTDLIIGLLIHFIGAPIVGGVVGFVMGITIILLPLAPVVGGLIGLYGTVAAIFEILVFAKVIKEPEAEKAVEEAAEETTDAE